MNYKIIQDEEEFKEFIDWLPDLQVGEQFYIALMARKKYDTTGVLKSDKAQIARTTATKDRIYDKIKKMETEVGSYKVDGNPVPQETLAVYIHPNPRCMKKASLKTLRTLVDNIEKDRYQNPKSVALNAVQVSKSRTFVLDFDLDMDKDKYYPMFLDEWVAERVGFLAEYKILESRGGYRILVQPSKVEEDYRKTWHQEISKHQYIDQKGDLLLPIPGCSQGGFVPKFI